MRNKTFKSFPFNKHYPVKGGPSMKGFHLGSCLSSWHFEIPLTDKTNKMTKEILHFDIFHKEAN